MDAKLYVGNLSVSTTEHELEALFAQAGSVTTVEVVKDRTSGESKGFAFVSMSSRAEADQAIRIFNAYSLDGHDLQVSLAIVK